MTGHRKLLGTLAALCAIVIAPGALATYSIVATDMATGHVGGAGTSCVGALSVRIIYGVAPGHGAVHAQAQVSTSGRDVATQLLFSDVDPADIVAYITAPSFDVLASRRQYGVVDLSGRAAGFTGAATMPFAADRQGAVGPYTYSIQGNILTSGLVIDQAEAAFTTLGCDLADKLMLALEAGAVGGEGDSRCTGMGIPADSAFLEVDPADWPVGTYLRIEVTRTRPLDPLVLLREQFDLWRAEHPCELPPQR